MLSVDALRVTSVALPVALARVAMVELHTIAAAVVELAQVVLPLAQV